MKKRISILLFLVLVNYLSSIAQEDVESRDTSEYNNNPEETTTENPDEATIDSLKAVMDNYAEECFKIEINFSGYENESEEIYYYDSLYVLRGYQSKWAMEGQSGEEYEWYDYGRLTARYEEIQGQQDEPDITFISNISNPNKLIKYESAANDRLQKIREYIRQNPENITEDDYSISLTIEETKNYGFDFIEKTEFYINKILYEKLF